MAILSTLDFVVPLFLFGALERVEESLPSESHQALVVPIMASVVRHERDGFVGAVLRV
jgi:hypothetical protein